ncbi:hypothetical protein CKO28_25875 [Rhodovibrio sodomensis]|uniref:DUF4139 domain-containing protein n=1 Tax=Rhodovibrio sodomensis TaxID=1088 RepID=A0ABS1DPM3_9PROT|nr:DUF4139 domain-containing protein [Rhodovibrio sodomensis]MBK1671433.1 hypothetical protein [Rhodovibrio sodomensis]
MTRSTPIALAAALLLASPAAAQDDGVPSGAGGDRLAIYQDDLALVTTERSVTLELGTAQLQIDRISPRIVPGSLDVSAPGLRVTQQQLAPWPLDRRALLEAYLGREVTLVRPGAAHGGPNAGDGERVTATLLSIENGIVLRIGDTVEVDPAGRIVFPDLPDTLSARPRADIRVSVQSGGQRRLTLRYLTQGLSWSTHYIARYDPEAGRLDLSGMARITNDLPVAFGARQVRLLAGQVSQVSGGDGGGPGPQRMAAMSARAEDARVPEPQTQADLKAYPLPNPLDLAPGGAVQVPLMQAENVAVERQYRLSGLATAYPYDGARGPSAATVRLRIADTARAGLGQPLPAGTLRVYAGDLYRGAQRIEATPVGGAVTVDLGRALDVTATARQTAYEQLSERSYETAQEITVKNAKDTPVEVQVLGNFPADWEIRQESHPHELQNASTPVWTLQVPAGGETVLTYRARVRR